MRLVYLLTFGIQLIFRYLMRLVKPQKGLLISCTNKCAINLDTSHELTAVKLEDNSLLWHEKSLHALAKFV